MDRAESRSLRRAIQIGLFVATLAVYSRVAGHEFVNYDDFVDIVQNPNLAGSPTPLALLRHFWTPYDGNWLPLYWISLHLGMGMHGASAPAFLLTNVVLHAASSVVLFVALERMTGAIARSAFVAAVFALHPLHVESVAWATERKDVLAGLFFMLGLYAWALRVESPTRWRRIAPLLCLVLGLLSKSVLVTFPFVLLLLDVWPLGRLRRDSVRALVIEKLPYFVLVGMASAVTVAVQESAGQMHFGTRLGLSARLVNAVRSYWLYLADAVWPTGLAVLYPHPFAMAPPTDADLWVAAIQALSLVAATTLVLLVARSHPYLPVGWLWYLGTLVPMIGLVHVGLQSRADRYMYVPLVGLAIAVTWGIAELVSKRPLLRRATAIGAIGVLAALAVATRIQLATWQDTISLFSRAAAVTERNRFAHENLAFALSLAGRDREAIEHFEEASRIDPRRSKSIFALATLQRRVGRRDEAIVSYQRGIEIEPKKIRAHGELGVLLVEAGRFDEALPHLELALAHLPEDVEFRAAREVIDSAGPDPD